MDAKMRKIFPAFPMHSIVTMVLLLLLNASLTGCAWLNEPQVMGVISEGVYTQPKDNFSCLLTADYLGLKGSPKITDVVRIVKTEDIPLSQRDPTDTKGMRIISDESFPSRLVTFKDKSGTVVEINSGKRRIHPVEMVLSSGMSGGVSWRFTKREVARSQGRMMMGLLLVPWHDEKDVYMGINAYESYRQGHGPDAQLWIVSNVVIEQAIHTVNVKIPIVSLLTPGTNPRDLSAVREDINSRPELWEVLLTEAENWLVQCQFSKEPK